jgi:hypothetical protein
MPTLSIRNNAEFFDFMVTIYILTVSSVSNFREKILSPRRASAAGGSLLPLSPRRTQVRLPRAATVVQQNNRAAVPM